MLKCGMLMKDLTKFPPLTTYVFADRAIPFELLR